MTNQIDTPLKVVDFHLHVGRRKDWHPEIHRLLAKLNPPLYERFDEVMQPKNIISLLDANKVDKAVVLAEYSPKVTGVVTNEFVAQFCKDHLDRLIPFCSIDPTNDPNPSKTLNAAITKLKMRGLKLYPTYQHFYPNAYIEKPQMKKLAQLYKSAQTLGIPIMFHTGTSVFPRARLKYGNPLFLDDIATDFPDLPIIIVHGGRGPWFQMAFYLTKIQPNVYLEISGLPPKNLLHYFPQLESIADKVLFGSDWPGILSIHNNIQEIKNLAMSEKAKAKILSENAIRLLKLKDHRD